MNKKEKNILWYRETVYGDVPLVGGKNASLGEMINVFSSKGINIPNGFSLTSKSYWYFLKHNKLDEKLEKIFKSFDPKSIKSLQATGKKARNLFLMTKFPKDLEKEILSAYKELSQEYKEGDTDIGLLVITNIAWAVSWRIADT